MEDFRGRLGGTWVGKPAYRSKCALNKAEKISAASEVEISSEARR